MENPKQKTGFALITPEEHQRIARLGGIAAQKGGKAHRFQPGTQEACDAGRKGGLAKHKNHEQSTTTSD